MRDLTMSAVIHRYDAVFLDAFGVLVDGAGALPGAVELIQELNRRDYPYLILTNDASRLPGRIAERFAALGMDIVPERILTSGALLARPELGLGGRCAVVLGPEDSATYARSAGCRVVVPTAADAEDLELVLCCDEGGFPFLETMDQVLTVMLRRLARGPLDLIVANPDLIYPSGADAVGFAAGMLAVMLERGVQVRYPRGAPLRVVRLGKPEALLFAAAVERVASQNVLMVGDQLETDIRGARAFGIDCAVVESPLTGALSDALPEAVRPTFRLRDLGFGV